MTISNDGATIMKLLDIVHPAAKVLADISMSQDAEVSSNPANHAPPSDSAMRKSTHDKLRCTVLCM